MEFVISKFYVMAEVLRFTVSSSNFGEVISSSTWREGGEGET